MVSPLDFAAARHKQAEEQQVASIDKAEVTVQEAAPVVGKTKGKASDIHETSKKNESDEAFEPLLSLVDSVVNVLSIPPLPPKTL